MMKHVQIENHQFKKRMFKTKKQSYIELKEFKQN
jgi:hypothetical protein